MINKNSVTTIVRKKLCTSCGICVGTCPKKCITMDYGKLNNVPIVNHNQCVNCGLCLKVCPGKGATLIQTSNQLFPNTKVNKFCGHYISCYVGYSLNPEIRYHSASGGMVTQFLTYLLEKGIIDGAVVVRYKDGFPFEPKPFIAKTKEEILESKSSKYIIVSYDNIVEEIKNFKGKLVVVGLPCHIQGLRNLTSLNINLREKIIGYFGIYCSLNKTKESIDYYAYRYRICKEKIKEFSFRDDGCMGFMKYTNYDNKVVAKIPYQKYWNGTKSFFMNDRCALCTDHFAELADVSFGDIHIEPYSQDKIGVNSIITRCEYWNTLLKKCASDKYLNLDTISIDLLISSQIYSKVYKKGAGLAAEFKLRKTLGFSIPFYDTSIEVKPRFSHYLKNIFRAIMRRIGNYRILWPLIKLIDR